MARIIETEKSIRMKRGRQKMEDSSKFAKQRRLNGNISLSNDYELTNSMLQLSQCSVGKVPPRDMKRLDKDKWYRVTKVASWGEAPAFFLEVDGENEIEDRDFSSSRFYKPPRNYFNTTFHVGDRVKLKKTGYSPSRNKIAQVIEIESTYPQTSCGNQELTEEPNQISLLPFQMSNTLSDHQSFTLNNYLSLPAAAQELNQAGLLKTANFSPVGNVIPSNNWNDNSFNSYNFKFGRKVIDMSSKAQSLSQPVFDHNMANFSTILNPYSHFNTNIGNCTPASRNLNAMNSSNEAATTFLNADSHLLPFVKQCQENTNELVESRLKYSQAFRP